jgi:hypothetical protein
MRAHLPVPATDEPIELDFEGVLVVARRGAVRPALPKQYVVRADRVFGGR